MITLGFSCGFGSTSTFPHSNYGNTQLMSKVLLWPQVQNESIHISPPHLYADSQQLWTRSVNHYFTLLNKQWLIKSNSVSNLGHWLLRSQRERAGIHPRLVGWPSQSAPTHTHLPTFHSHTQSDWNWPNAHVFGLREESKESPQKHRGNECRTFTY